MVALVAEERLMLVKHGFFMIKTILNTELWLFERMLTISVIGLIAHD
jgi:hypothetical protein